MATTHKRLYRSRQNKIIAGVAGGIAEYFEIDPTIIRLLFVLLAFAEGAGILIYIIAWLIVPENPDQPEIDRPNERNRSEKAEPAGQDLRLSSKEEKAEATQTEGTRRLDRIDGDRTRQWFGIILLLLGLIFFFNLFTPLVFLIPFWPIILILVGLWIIFSHRSERK